MPSFFQKKTHKRAKRAGNNLAMSQVLHARKTKLIPSFSQLSQLPRFLTPQERYIGLGAFLLVITAGTLLTFQLINSNRVSVPAVGGEYTEGLVNAPKLINPLYASANDADNDLSRLIYSGLMRVDSSNKLVTDLAESYTISEDGKVYTFKLRNNAKWHDGEKVTVEDVIFTYSAIQNPDYQTPLRLSFSGVGIKQIDENTVEFTLDEPFSPFLSLLTTGLLPSHLWQNVAPMNAMLAELNKKPIGSGPYMFEKLVHDSEGTVYSYTLERNDDFYREGPYIETLNLKFYPDTTTNINALRNQNIEGIGYLPQTEIHTFENQSQILLPASKQYTATFFNRDNQPILDSEEVREALSYATNKDELVSTVLGGNGNVLGSFLLPGMIGAKDEYANTYDQEKARELLESDDWILEDGASIRTKDGEELALELTTVDVPSLFATAELLQQQWNAIGVKTTIVTVTNVQLQNEILKEREYDILLSGELYGVDPDFYSFWHSSQTKAPGFNLAGFSNRNADELIDLGRTTTDPEERLKAYQDLEQLILDDISAIFLYQPIYPYATSEKIKNVNVSQIISPADRFNEINTWYIKTKKVLSNE